jgi:hypothetical protein
MSKQGRNSSLKPNAIKTALRDERAHVPSDSEGGRRRFPELAHRKPEIRPPIALRVDAKLKEYAGRAIARITSCGTSDGQAVLNPRRSVVVHTFESGSSPTLFGLDTDPSQPGHGATLSTALPQKSPSAPGFHNRRREKSGTVTCSPVSRNAQFSNELADGTEEFEADWGNKVRRDAGIMRDLTAARGPW